MRRIAVAVLAAAGIATVAGWASEQEGKLSNEIVVSNTEELCSVLKSDKMKPGVTVLIAPGTYGNLWHDTGNLRGTEEAPIVIRAQDPKNPPVLDAEGKKDQALGISGACYLVI